MKTIFNLNLGIAVVLLVAVSACEPKKQDSTEIAEEQNDAVLDDRDDEKDADFIVNAIASNYAEIKMAQLAKNKSGDDGIKKVASMLENDHTELVKQLQGYAAMKGITVPLEETEDDKKAISNLAEESSPVDFNKKWCSALEDRHSKSIDKFEKRLDKTEDVELKNLITNTLPALRSHLAMIKEHQDTSI